MASSQGSATVAPNAPRRKVRRDRCFFVMIMAALSRLPAGVRHVAMDSVSPIPAPVRIWNGALSTIP